MSLVSEVKGYAYIFLFKCLPEIQVLKYLVLYLPKFSTYHAFFFERASLLSGLFKYWQVGIKMGRPKSLNDNILQFHHICLNVVQTTNALNIFHIKKKFLLKQCLCSFDIYNFFRETLQLQSRTTVLLLLINAEIIIESIFLS